MKALRAKFFGFSDTPIEYKSHVPKGLYWRISLKDRISIMDVSEGEPVPRMGLRAIEFRLQAVNEDEKGAYYHYYFERYC